MSLLQMTPFERRDKARCIRGMIRTEKTMAQAHTAHKVSRAHAYRMLEELEAWETAATFEQEAAEVNQIFPKYDSAKWLMVSGRMLTAYAKGEIDASLLGQRERPEDIGIDPLLA